MNKQKFSNNIKKEILENVQQAWQNSYNSNELIYSYPNEILLKLFFPIKKDIRSILDVGCGSKNNTNWIKKKKITSIDICKIKNDNKIYVLDFLLLKNIKKKKFINNSDFIILNQFLDHQFYEDAEKFCGHLNKYYIKTKYIFTSFLTNKCRGIDFKKKKLIGNTYLSRITLRPGIQDLELHTYLTRKKITSLLSKFKRFKVIKRLRSSEVVYNYENNYNKKICTDYYLLKNKNY